MAEAILMPRLSDTMTEGVIAAWHKKVGDSVKKGDLLAEVETDKATMDLIQDIACSPDRGFSPLAEIDEIRDRWRDARGSHRRFATAARG